MDQTVQGQTPQPVVQPQAAQEVTSQPPIIPTSPEAPETPSRPPRKIPFVIIIVLVFLLAGGVLAYFWLQQPTSQEPAPVSQKTISAPSPTPITQAAETYVGYQTISLRDVSGGTSSGSTTRSIIPGNVFISVDAVLPDPGEGQFYQAWLITNEGVSTSFGGLSKTGEGTYSSVGVFNTPTFASFDEVLFNTMAVTLESTDDDVMETKLLDGRFTQ